MRYTLLLGYFLLLLYYFAAAAATAIPCTANENDLILLIPIHIVGGQALVPGKPKKSVSGITKSAAAAVYYYLLPFELNGRRRRHRRRRRRGRVVPIGGYRTHGNNKISYVYKTYFIRVYGNYNNIPTERGRTRH